MSRIFTTTYEVIGEGVAIANGYYAEIEAARKEHWAFVESVGGDGFRPAHDGGLRAVFFAELPKGWRKVGREGKHIEAVPYKTSAAGKELVQRIRSLALAPRPHQLASSLGYSPSEMALDPDRGTIYFPTEIRVSHPEERTFLRLPRFATDGFEPDPAILRELPESALMLAIETHNAEAKRQREAEPAHV